jgi:hypothetical protein
MTTTMMMSTVFRDRQTRHRKSGAQGTMVRESSSLVHATIMLGGKRGEWEAQRDTYDVTIPIHEIHPRYSLLPRLGNHDGCDDRGDNTQYQDCCGESCALVNNSHR